LILPTMTCDVHGEFIEPPVGFLFIVLYEIVFCEQHAPISN